MSLDRRKEGVAHFQCICPGWTFNVDNEACYQVRVLNILFSGEPVKHGQVPGDFFLNGPVFRFKHIPSL